ncbi:MAG TPA: hypothetical protein VHW64_05860 [Nocardioides sp.]|uniref:hypothetical protein n=1 Tax=Nocardioides sp. TaxID=35761 RepID=UPI002E321661|nr:hypothetical protein [Nocardioides sp.]HEX3930208.1 hypothetical protein [Nocardioides sp.]
MTTIADLRRVLDQHADEVGVPQTVARTAGVHQRVAAVRRRRRAVAVGTLALVVLGGAAVAVVPRLGPAQPAAPTLLGRKAPTTMHALGFTYRTDGHGETFAGSGSFHLSESDQPRLFTWTTSPRSSVVLGLPDNTRWHSRESRFRDYVVVPAGESGTVQVSAPNGRVGIASYDLTGAPPPGYTKAGLTYRSDVAGTALLRAMVSDRGQVDLRGSFSVPDGAVAVAPVCSGLPADDVIHLAFDGSERTEVSGSQCDSSDFADAGSHVTSTFSAALRPGTEPGTAATMRMWVTHGDDDTQVVAAGSAPDLRMGLGVYGSLRSERVGGDDLPDRVEYLGHTWALRTIANGSTGGVHPSLPVSKVDRVIGIAWTNHGRIRVSFHAGTASGGGEFSGVGSGSIGDLWAAAGTTPTVTLTGGTGRYGIAAYERID